MNQVLTIEQPQQQAQRLPAVRSVLIDMATRYGMEPAAFEATVRATCMRPDSRTGYVPSREEFAAFLLVAKEYNLNPLTKEIYAFASKGGGIVPIVSVDGWVNLINSHGACDGFEFEMQHDENNNLLSCTCRMYRKDRTHPVVVTEYLGECLRPTEPWKMRHRMLRHKTLIQAGRYAFGFSGIYDEDEAAKIVEAKNVTLAPRDEPPAPPPAQIAHQPQIPMEAVRATDELVEMVTTQPPAETVEWTELPSELEAVATEQPPAPPPPAKSQPVADSGFPGDKPMSTKHDIPADGGIPEFLRQQSNPVEEWLASLGNALSGCESTEQLAEAQNKYQAPMHGKVSKEAWERSRKLVMEAFQRISESE